MEREAERLDSQYSRFKGTTKELTVQEKTLQATYTKPEKAEGIQKHDRLVYTTKDAETLKYDALTGQLVFLQRPHLYEKTSFSTTSRIPEEQALNISNEFMEKYCYDSKDELDTLRYSLIDINYHEITGYTKEYSYLIHGYKTSEVIAISVTDSGEISFFSYHPHIFDDVEIKPVDEQVLLKQLDRQVRFDNKYSLVNYEIAMQRLAVDDNDELIMEFEVLIEFSITHADGEKDILMKGVMYQIKV